MKKLYSLVVALVATMTFAQVPIITMIADNGCTGGTPKVLEIYANGTVDFTQYSLQNQPNANTAWGATQDLSALGTLTNTFVYVFHDGSYDNFFTEYSSAIPAQSIESGTLNLNGDDRVRIINTTTQVVIDQFGVSDLDGTGTPWETLDSYAKRVNGTGPDAGFVIGNWTFAPIDSTDGQGLCNSATAFGILTGAGTYSASALGVSDVINVKSNFVQNTFVTDEIQFGAKSDVKIYNMNGQVVKAASVSEFRALDASDLQPGMYIVTGSVEGQPVSQKILKK